MFNRDILDMELIDGPVQFAHQFMDVPEYKVNVTDSNTGSTTEVMNR